LGRSPERIIGGEYSYSADIWSLGLIVYELASLLFPYEANTTLLLIDKIINDTEPVLQDSGEFSSELIDFLKKW
jgi:serine/threonine protein kinase